MYTLEGSHCVQPTPKAWGVIFSLLKGKASTTYVIWNSCAWEIFLSFLIYKFIQSFNHLYSYLFYIWDYNSILSFFSNCFSCGNSFSCLLYYFNNTLIDGFFGAGVGFYFSLFCFSISLLLGTTRCSRLILYISCPNRLYL